MSKKFGEYEYVQKKISERVKEKRLKKGLTQLDLVPNNNNYVSAIENNKALKVNSKGNTNKKEVRYKNFLPHNLAIQISEALEITIEELYLGKINEDEGKDEKDEFKELVKRIYDSLMDSVHVKEFNYDSIEKDYDFPQFKEVLIFFEQLMRFNAEYSYLLYNIRQRNLLYIEVDKKILTEEEEREKNLNSYDVAYKKMSQYIWKKYNEDIMDSFYELFIDSQGDFKCPLPKFDSIVEGWINNEFYVLLKTIYADFLEDTVYNIGYQVDDLAEKIFLIDEKELFYYSEDEIKFFDDYFKNLLSTDSSDLCGDDEKIRMMNEEASDMYKEQLGEYSKMKKRAPSGTYYNKELERINVEKEVSQSLRSAYLDTMRTLVKIQNEALNKEPYA